LNKAYRTLRCKTTGKTVVAHERSKSHSGLNLKRSLVSLAVAAALALPFAPSDALAITAITVDRNNGHTINTSLFNGTYFSDLSIYSYTPSQNNTKTQVNNNAITVNQGVTHVDASGNYPGLSILNSIYSNGTGTETHRTEIFSNTITNNGSLDGSGNHPGLLIKAITGIYNASPGYSYADVSGNTIANKGSISGSGNSDVKYGGGALSIAAFSQTYYVGVSRSQVLNNIISNSGEVSSSSGSGIGLSSSAIGEINDGKYIYQYNHRSRASVNGNTITNSGNIIAPVGISLVALARSSGAAYADVSGNTITNTSNGSISSDYGYSESLILGAVSFGPRARAYVSNNTISNAGYLQGVIGLESLTLAGNAQSFVTGNNITNSGSMVVDNFGGVALISAAITPFGNDYSNFVAKSFIQTNQITNTGSISVLNLDASGSSLKYSGAVGLTSIAVGKYEGDSYVRGNQVVNKGSIIVSDASGYSGKYHEGAVSLTSIAFGYAQGYSDVSGNQVVNTGSITVNSAYGATAVRMLSGAYSGKYSLSSVSGNTISNSGTMLSQGTDPSGNILVRLDSYAIAKYQSKSLMNDNIITNSGKLTGGGMRLKSEAVSSNSSDPTLNSDVRSLSEMSGNQITNSGTISLNSENARAAIDLSSYSWLSNDSLKLGVVPDATKYSKATATIEGNVISNSGTIVSSGSGIRLFAVGHADSQANDAYANLLNNVITNSGAITINVPPVDNAVFGIELKAHTESYFHHTNFVSASITDLSNTLLFGLNSYTYNSYNTIRNSGKITSAGGGISVYADSYANPIMRANVNSFDSSGTPISVFAWSKSIANENEITNSGTIKTTGVNQDGISLYARSFTDISSAVSFDPSGSTLSTSITGFAIARSHINENTITNSGTIDSAQSGITLDAYNELRNYLGVTRTGVDASGTFVVGLTLSNSSSIYIEGNTISNSGSIVARNGDGIRLSARTSSYIGSVLTVDEIYASNVSGTLNYSHIDNTYINNNTITNSGTITASDDGIRINSGHSNRIVNNFQAITSGGDYKPLTDGSGINLTPSPIKSFHAEIVGNTITNSGVINAGGNGISMVAGLYSTSFSNSLVEDNYILNSGTINASNHGILMYSYGSDGAHMLNNSITNTGVIKSGAIGIYGWSEGTFDGNTINNSGLIVSSGNDRLEGIPVAIRMQGIADPSGSNFNTLNLTAPAFIGGKIQLQEAARFNVNLTSGVSHSVNWTFDHTGDYDPLSFSTLNPGSTPWFSNAANRNYATLDPSAFAASSNMLADTANLVSSMNKFGLDRGIKSEKTNSWLAVQANAFDYDGDGVATQKQKSKLYGIGAGFSQQYSAETVLGVMVGYNRNDLSVSGRFAQSYKNKTDGAFAGIFGSTKLNKVVIDYALNGGYMDHKDKRFVNDNLASDGISFADASYNSTWIAPELKVSLPYQIAGGLTATPNINLRYAHQSIDGYTESGSNANASVNSRTIGSAEGRVGFMLSKDMDRGRISAHVDYLRRQATGDDKVRVSMIGDSQDVSFYTKDLNAAVFGADVRFNITKDFVLDATGNYMLGDNVSGGNATASLKYLF
jgi:Autotransporter beta-domain/Extended Signal Peptide of Type V secretion system